MTKRAPRVKAPIPLIIPPPVEGIDNWLIFGLDPSLSRTGYALMRVEVTDGEVGKVTKARWLEVGSIKPMDTTDPIWIRSKNIAMGLRGVLNGHRPTADEVSNTGLIISMEYPTPQNDFLVALNRIIHLVFFDNPGVPFEKTDMSVLSNNFATVRVLLTNASTLRSQMGLTLRGAKNKAENITRAYDFINRDRWPSLDTDSCDAVLLAMMARHAASILLGYPEEIPPNFRLCLTNGNKEVKGKGTRERTITKGLLHRTEYWYSYEPKVYSLGWKDARDPKRKLNHTQAVI